MFARIAFRIVEKDRSESALALIFWRKDKRADLVRRLTFTDHVDDSCSDTVHLKDGHVLFEREKSNMIVTASDMRIEDTSRMCAVIAPVVRFKSIMHEFGDPLEIVCLCVTNQNAWCFHDKSPLLSIGLPKGRLCGSKVDGIVKQLLHDLDILRSNQYINIKPRSQQKATSQDSRCKLGWKPIGRGTPGLFEAVRILPPEHHRTLGRICPEFCLSEPKPRGSNREKQTNGKN